jgi:hypothetical protein
MNPLKSLLFITFLILPVFSNAQKTIKLFNGKNLKGWYAYEPGTGKHTNASEIFKVDHNIIRLYGNKAGYLMTKQSFKNFRLTAEFKWNNDTTFVRKSDKRNSGLMYMVPIETPDTLWPAGIQFQIKDGVTGDFVLLKHVCLTVDGKKTEPGETVVVKKLADAIKPDGEWNTLVVTSIKGKIKQELNGKLVNEGCDPSVSQGRILLQYEGFPIDFRKIEIQKL